MARNETDKNAAIKDYFVEIEEDKFSGETTVNTRHRMEWGDSILKNVFVRHSGAAHTFFLSPAYVKTGEEDDILLKLGYTSIDGEHPGLYQMEIHFLLDGEKTIVVKDGDSEYHSRAMDGDFEFRMETCTKKMLVSELADIAHAKKVQFSIRHIGKLEGTMGVADHAIFKGLYHSVFDEAFAVDELDDIAERDLCKTLNTEDEAINDENKEYVTGKQQANAANSQKKEGCYIATMAYGDYDHPQVMVLRRYREELRQRKWGPFLIKAYYRTSPVLVRLLRNNRYINNLIRKQLDKLIVKIEQP